MTTPAYLQKYKKEAEVQGQSLVDSSTSVPRVSLKGKKFKLLVGGEEIQKPSQKQLFVILDVQPEGRNFIKTYYEGTFNPNDTSPPECSSSDGIRPDEWVNKPQSDSCQICPKNRFGSATSAAGRKAKACKDSKRLFVTLPDDLDGTVFILNVPVTSLKNLADYGRKILADGFPLFAVITEFAFVEDEDYPVLDLKSVGFLDEEGADAAYKLTQRHTWRSKQTSAPISRVSEPAITDESIVTEVTEVTEVTGADTTHPDVDDIAESW